ncbi:cilia- and flagella-associated protein 100 [Aulostomus maculatus]
MRRWREAQQSPFKVPDSNGIFVLSLNEKTDRKEEKQSVMRDSKHEMISMERQKAVLEISVMTTRSEIVRMDEAVAKEERQLNLLEKVIEKDNLKFEEFLKENEKKSVEARTFFEREVKAKQEKNAEIKRLTSQIGTVRSELVTLEDILKDLKRYQEVLFKLSPPEWQETQSAKHSTKALPHKNSQDEQGLEPESTPTHGVESEAASPSHGLPSIREPGWPSERSPRVMNSKPDTDSLEYEDEPELYFTDPQQLLYLMTELTEQNLSLIQNSARVEETLDELRLSMETTSMKIEKDEEHRELLINDMNRRIREEKGRAAKLQQKVQLHVSLNTEDQDDMLDAIGEKVADVHRCCVDERVSSLSTLEKLASIEIHMSSLLQSLERIPEERLEMMQKIKDSERRSRQREEKQREQREKQRERTRRYLERSLADAQKRSGRKLMPRCLPGSRKVRGDKVESAPVEEDVLASLFTADDTD